jgi:uncharacterized protein
MKKIMLIGSSGTVRQRILHEALNRGHHVTALVRETSGTGEQRGELNYHTGDIFKPDTVAAAAVDHDVVVSAYGRGKGDPGLVVTAARSLIEALEVYRKAGTAEFDWTAVSSPALVTPGTRTGKYRTGTDQLRVDDRDQSCISAEDFALAIVDEIEKPHFQSQRFTVAY